MRVVKKKKEERKKKKKRRKKRKAQRREKEEKRADDRGTVHKADNSEKKSQTGHGRFSPSTRGSASPKKNRKKKN
jgi:hypothetical protein